MEFVRGERSALTSVFVSNLLLGIAGVVSGFVLARTLRPEGRGLLGSIQAIPFLVAGFSLLGMQEGVVYCGIRQPDRRRAYLSAGLVISTAAAAVASAALIVLPFGLVHRSWAHESYVLFIVMTPITLIPLNMLQASGRFTAWSLLRSTTTIAWLGLALVTAALPAARSAYFVGIGYICALGLLAPFFLWIGYRSTEPGPKPSLQDARNLLRFGLPFTLTAAPLALNLRLDVAVVSSKFPRAQIGYYVTAVAWSALLTPAFSTLSTLAMPIVARRKTQGEASYSVVIVSLALGLIAIAAIVSVPLTHFAFPLMFGSDYRPATNLASLALVAGAVQGGREVVASTVRGHGQVKLPLVAELAGFAVTGTTLWVFLDRFGLQGGQWSSLLAYSTSLLAMLVVAAFQRRGSPERPG